MVVSVALRSSAHGMAVVSAVSRYACRSRRWLSGVGDGRGKKVVVAMSGGIDSSVAAMLLKDQGYDVTGVFMKNWDSSDEFGIADCPNNAHHRDMKEVCERLQIPALETNFVKEYWTDVFEPFLDAYNSCTETPNPDVHCNRTVKFGHFRKYVQETLGIDTIATGHYARMLHGHDSDDHLSAGGRPRLMQAKDSSKDQTYFLCMTAVENFSKVLFPIGSYEKSDVKKLAANRFEGLNVLTKKESMGLCFIGKRPMGEFLQNYIKFTPGHFIDIDTNKQLGTHSGAERFTGGQRARIGGSEEPYYVAMRNDPSNMREGSEAGDVFVASGWTHPALFTEYLVANASECNWLSEVPECLKIEGAPFMCLARTKYREVLKRCQIHVRQKGNHSQPPPPPSSSSSSSSSVSRSINWNGPKAALEGYEIVVEFEAPRRGVSAGQVVALYDADGQCLGGLTIQQPGLSFFAQGRTLSEQMISDMVVSDYAG